MKKTLFICLVLLFSCSVFCETQSKDTTNIADFILSFSEDKYNLSQAASSQYFSNFIDTPFPPEKLNRCAEYKPEIIEEIKAIGPDNLVDDTIFINVLKAVLNDSNRSTEDKVYFFYEMLDSFCWGFCGVLRAIPMSHHYASEVIFRGSTFAFYRNNLKECGIDSAPYFELCHKYMQDKPILASYSLLLGCLLEKNDAILSDTLKMIQTEELYKVSPVFASLIFHNASIISLLISFSSFNYDASDILIKLFREAQREEEKEDLIVALCFAKSQDPIKIAFDEVLAIKKSSHESVVKSFFKSVQTRHKQGVSKAKEKKEFKKLVNLYLELSTEDWQKQLAKSIIDCDCQFGYVTPTQAQADRLETDKDSKSFDKIWDDFSFEIYSNGSFVVYGDYVQFLPSFKNQF